MAKQIYINLPVQALDRSMEFFRKLGFSFNPQFTDENAACLVLGENIYAMLLTEKFFQTFTDKQITDSRTSTEVLICIDAESKQAVDEMVQKAVSAGGRVYREPQDHGFMYQNSFEDLDGHNWEIVAMLGASPS